MYIHMFRVISVDDGLKNVTFVRIITIGQFNITSVKMDLND